MTRRMVTLLILEVACLLVVLVAVRELVGWWATVGCLGLFAFFLISELEA